MKTNTTRKIASLLVSNLRAGDRVAAIQFGVQVETIQSWTTETEKVAQALNSKLFSGKRSRLVDALVAGAESLREVPVGGRHVVLITDGVVIVDTDIAMRRERNKYLAETKLSEKWLASLADTTGGMMVLGSSEAELIKQAAQIVREIDSQYVVAYGPKRPLALAAEGEFRSIRVAARRTGLQIHARRGYVAKPEKR